MRLKLKEVDNRATRIVSRFLWFPKLIDREWRWLERATWEEKNYGFYYGFRAYKWENP